MTCSRCGAVVEGGAQWCATCGTSVAAPAGYGAPAPAGYGAPAPAGYGAPAPAGYGAPAPAGYGAPAPAGYGAPAPAGYGAPAPAGYGAPAPAGYGAPAPAGYGAPAPARGCYSPDDRVLACEQCGAPLTVPIAGGAVPCGACGVTLTAPPRPNTVVPPSPPTDERARLERLRQQDGRPLMAPPGLEGVVTNGRIEPWKLPEARLVWGQTRRHLIANPFDAGAAERLSFLTVALSNEVCDQPNPNLPLRGIYEGALEALSLPRHRQVMRGMLARRAARTGDLAAAQGWLGGCDPASAELMTDSAYRLSLAVCATVGGDPATVVRVLGRTPAEVPTEDSMDAMAAVLRANAVEKLGDVAGAGALLAQFAAVHGMATVETIAKALPRHLQICAQSLAAARGAHRQRVASSAGGTGWIGWIILGAGCLPIVIVLPLIIAGEAPIFAAIFVIVFPLVFGGWGLKMIRGARRSRLIAQTGLQGTGRILAVNQTGTMINNVPMMRITMQVTVPGYPPVQASMTKLLQPHNAAGLVGGEVNVLWHPSYPTEVVIEE